MSPSLSPHHRSRRRLSLQRPKGNIKSAFLCYGLIASVIFLLGLWICMFSSFWTLQHSSSVEVPAQPLFRHGKKEKKNDKGGGRSLNNKQSKPVAGSTSKKNDKGGGKSLSSHNKNKQREALAGSTPDRHSRKPRVVGTYAYQIHELDGWKEDRSTNTLPPYIYLTERIDPYLLSHAPQALRRIRHHNYYNPEETSLSDFKHNYDLAIAGSDADVRTEDPLKHLMLTSDSRDTLNEIHYESEDYESYMADPLEDEECEATPNNAKWMLHSFPTCNYIHEFDFPNTLKRGKTKLLGHGYWRDVWPVLDTAPASSRSSVKKVALKTIRYEHDYTGRNYDRHVRDAIVSERLTSSPRVTDIHSFCGNSGYFEFASGGSLADRLEEHYTAIMEENDEEETGKNEESKDDSRILDKYSKLKLAFEVAAGIADFHEADALRDENGEITSAAIAHADITTDQFIHVGDVYKLNDFNRCRFMRQYRNTTNPSGGDGKPCGFYIQNNPGKSRAPEEYAYTVETEKIDIYSMANIFYTILTDMDPWEDEGSSRVEKLVMQGKRPRVPSSIKSSEDPSDVAIRKMMNKCWEQAPGDRPRARYVADYLSKRLNELDNAKKKTE